MTLGASAYGQIPYSASSGSGAAKRLSAWNFCDPFDYILPPADGTISEFDRAHLWGMYIGVIILVIADPPVNSLMLLKVGR